VENLTVGEWVARRKFGAISSDQKRYRGKPYTLIET